MEGKGPTIGIILGLSVVAFAILLGTHIINFGPTQTQQQSVVTQTGPSGQTITTPISPALWATTTSALTIQVSDRDALANSALTEGTNIQTDYWSSPTGAIPMQFLAAASTSTPFGATFNVTPQMGGMVYIRTQIVTGQSYYIAPIVTQQNNPCIQAFDFLDVQNTGTQQWVFQCNLAKSNVNPSPTTNAAGNGGTSPLLTYTAFADAYTKPTITYNNGGSIKSIGTGTNVQNQILYVEKNTAAKAFAVSEIDIAVNNTSAPTYINQGLSNIQLPIESSNGGISYQTLYFTSANIAGLSDGTNTNWKWYFNAPQDTTFGVSGSQQNNNLKGAYLYFALQNGGPAQIPFTTNVFTTLTTNLNIAVTEKHVFTTPSQATDSNSQAVTLCAGTSCT